MHVLQLTAVSVVNLYGNISRYRFVLTFHSSLTNLRSVVRRFCFLQRAH